MKASINGLDKTLPTPRVPKPTGNHYNLCGLVMENVFKSFFVTPSPLLLQKQIHGASSLTGSTFQNDYWLHQKQSHLKLPLHPRKDKLLEDVILHCPLQNVLNTFFSRSSVRWPCLRLPSAQILLLLSFSSLVEGITFCSGM